MTQNTSPVLAGVQTIFAVPRNLWLATSGAVGGGYRKTKARALLPVSARCIEGAREKVEGAGVTGKPVSHLRFKPFILRTPQEPLDPMGVGGFTHVLPFSWNVLASFPHPPVFPSVSLLTHQASASKKKKFFFFLLPGSSFQPPEEVKSPLPQAAVTP